MFLFCFVCLAKMHIRAKNAHKKDEEKKKVVPVKQVSPAFLIIYFLKSL